MRKAFYVKQTHAGRTFDIVNTALIALLMFIMIYPFWNVLVFAFNDGSDAVLGKLYFWPRKFSLNNFEYVFKNKSLLHGAMGIRIAGGGRHIPWCFVQCFIGIHRFLPHVCGAQVHACFIYHHHVFYRRTDPHISAHDADGFSEYILRVHHSQPCFPATICCWPQAISRAFPIRCLSRPGSTAPVS